MSIAEKLTTVAENQQKVYDAGKQAENDRFWDSYQQNGNRTNYIGAFAGQGWTIDNCKPKYDMQPTDCTYMFFQNKFIKSFPEWLSTLNGITIDFSQSTNMRYLFSGSDVTEVGTIDCSSCTNIYAMFDNCYYLKTVGKLIINDGTSYDYFLGGCSALENITIEGVLSKTFSIGSCGKLTRESLLSIINALKDYSGSGTTYKLTLHAVAKARLSEADIAIATQKGWTIA